MRPVLAMLAVLAAVGAASAAASSSVPNVRIVSLRPLVTIGSHFRGHERVRVRFTGARRVAVSVRTNAAGSFRAGASVAIDPCLGPVSVKAVGRSGDRAFAKAAARECPPDNR